MFPLSLQFAYRGWVERRVEMRLRSITRLAVSALLVSLVCLPAGAGSAAVTAAPTAITGPVTAVGSTSATAGGTVNPGGQTTSW
jgi:hypothetical protein